MISIEAVRLQQVESLAPPSRALRRPNELTSMPQWYSQVLGCNYGRRSLTAIRWYAPWG